jgi:hypothetical protein
MAQMKQIITVAVASILSGAIALSGATAGAADSPEELLEIWQTALVQGDHQTYAACLHSGTRGVPEYASEEAMSFWAHEMEQLRRRGFAGRFEIEVVTDAGPRLPPGTVLAHPIVDGQPIRDAIVLIREAGRWRILRLFS